MAACSVDKRVLVTGGAGFIGSALVRRLLKGQYEVTAFDDLSTGLRDNLPENTKLRFVQGDVRDFEFVSSTIRKHPYVMHLAAQAFVPLSYQKPVQVAAVNALGSLNVFKACLDHGVKRLVYISSSEVYGTAQYIPMNEQHPLHPHSTYAVAKATADLWAQTLRWERSLPVVILRPFNTYGPRESLPYFIPEMIRQCLKTPKIHVGNLKTSRDFTYIDDVTDAMTAALQAPNIEGQIINIGTKKTWRMEDTLNLIKKQTKTEEKEVIIDENRLRPNDVNLLVTDNTKAKKLLGWEPHTTFQEGLRKTIQWYLKNGKLWGYEKHRWPWRY
jgi:nucleoside-diphosphate-sugar epimerase